MTYTVCIDIGGTFTDCVVTDQRQEVRLFKAPSTPEAFEHGFMDVLRLAAEGYDLALQGFLQEVDLIVHGTTVSTNALIVGSHARTGFITNAGFPDVLLLREGPRKRSFAWRLDYPDAFVPRNLTCEVGGRIDARGNEIEPLVRSDVEMAADHLVKMGAEAVAVSLLWSIVNPRHEIAVKEILSRRMPGVPIVLGHELNPIPREYRRAIATVIDAALHPVVSKYVSTLTQALHAASYGGEVLIANCAGGMMPPDEIVKSPIYSVMSGPTLAPIAALGLTAESNIIVVDMGGTTFDVSAVRDRRLVVTAEALIGKDLLGIPKVDVRSVGAGGGSIASVDSGGLLKVGPQSAGARPGPACYGTGGTEPTVTDANVVLGIIDPDYFLGGRIRLEPAAARRAISKIADRLGIGLIEAAYAIHTTTNHNMVAAIEDITVNEGLDPRESYLVSGGGGTGCHIAQMATILGLKRYVVPKLSAALSAYGGLISDIRFQNKSTHPANSRHFQFETINSLLRNLRDRGALALKRAGVHQESWSFEFECSGRYEFQSWEIDVPFILSEPHGLDENSLKVLVSAFHDVHDRIYAIKDEGELVEFVTWTVTAVGQRTRSRLLGRELSRQTRAAQPKSRRSVYLHAECGSADIPVYDGNLLGSGAKLIGPCIIEEDTTTVLILPGMVAETDRFGSYEVNIG
jgi:N-methylhydantoinase A